MKKKLPIIVVAVIIVVVFIAHYLSNNEEKAEKTNYPLAVEKPEDTNLEFWITEYVPRIQNMGYEEIGYGFGVTTYLGKKYETITEIEGFNQAPEQCVLYSVTAYPDYADGGQYITEIEITDPEITVYDLTVNSSFEEFDKTFEAMGYEIEVWQSGSCISHTATKGQISFTLDYVEQKPRTLTIKAEVTNREGIHF